MKKLLGIVVLGLLLSGNAFSKHKKTEQMYKWYNYGSDGSENYKKFETELIEENKYTKLVDKQLLEDEK